MQAEIEETEREVSVEELSCSVCMCLFQTPVTIECGHTFCRSCILNSVRSKNSCPMCRTNLVCLSDRPHHDETLNQIVQQIRSKSKSPQQTGPVQNDQPIYHFQNILLLDIRTSQLLLPFSRVPATFQLQSPSLLSKLDKFVARQEKPFNRFGVVSKITYLNQLRHNVYQCILEGRSFCSVEQEWVERGMDSVDEFFYRNCKAKFIHEDEEFDMQIFEPFFEQFLKIKDKKLLQRVFEVVSYEKLTSKTDSLAVYYSIMKILATPDEKKYEVITSFDKKERQHFLSEYFEAYRREGAGNSSPAQRLLAAANYKSKVKQGWAAFLIFMMMIFYFSSQEQQANL